VTYVLDETHVIRGAFNHEFQVNRHLDEVLKFARELRMSTTVARRAVEKLPTPMLSFIPQPLPPLRTR
jgi:hypothetical protein